MPNNYVSMRKATYHDYLNNPPNVIVLPLGATEAHNYHLPYASDAMQAEMLSEYAAALAVKKGAKITVLPGVPFGNNGQQVDQICTIHLSTRTTFSILEDVVKSLVRQKIDRLVLVNSHGGNAFEPIVRDLQNQYPILIAVVNLYEMIPDKIAEIFNNPGDHAGEWETSMMMYLTNDGINLDSAGDGERIPFKLQHLNQPGVWTPRPWKQSHPDTGSGNPKKASFEKGKQYVEALCQSLSEVMLELSLAQEGDLPYLKS